MADGFTAVAFIGVTDREAGRAFYGDVLELPHESADVFGDYFVFGGALLRMTAMPDFQPSPHPVIGLEVPDISAALTKLRSRGIEFIVYDGMGQDALGVWTAPEGGAKLAWFKDPFGNLLSLSQT